METFLSALAETQARAGLTVSLLAQDSVKAGLFGLARRRWKGASVFLAPVHLKLVYAPLTLHYRSVLNKVFRETTPDIVHVHVPNPSALLALTLPALRRVPWVLQWQSDIVYSELQWKLRILYWFYRPLERWFLRRAAAIVVSSPNYLRTSSALADYRDKAHIIPLGIPLWPLAQLPQRRPEAGAGFSVLMVGRLTYYKGHEYLVRAMQWLPDMVLTLVGDGECAAAVRREAVRLGLESRVRMLGSVPDEVLQQEYADCDCFCLPSIERTESFGMVLLEAMEHARPCIVSSVEGSGINYVVQHEQTGLVVPPADPEALASAILRLKNNPEEARRFGAAGRQRLESHFSIDRVSEQLLALYHQLLEPPESTR
jgi:rhamnosyl/mannosyltransferase